MVEEPFDHLDCFLDLSIVVCVLVHSSEAVEKRKETFASMCDERARMLQDQFNVSMNHVQAMSIVISTFHHGKRLSAIDQDQDSNAHMAYWLSNTSVLLFLLQRTLKATSAKPLTPTSFFGRMTQGFRSSLSFANLSFYELELYQVEAKYPALLFKQHLTTYVKKIYGIVRDNSKKDLSSLLSSCIQGCCNSKSQRETCPRGHSTIMQRSLNFRLRCLDLWTSLSTHFITIKISSLENMFGMVVNIFVYGGHVLF